VAQAWASAASDILLTHCQLPKRTYLLVRNGPDASSQLLQLGRLQDQALQQGVTADKVQEAVSTLPRSHPHQGQASVSDTYCTVRDGPCPLEGERPQFGSGMWSQGCK